MRFRLSTMMFIQFTATGVILPLISLYMKQSLGFSGQQIGTIFAVSSVSSFVAPLIGSLVADRIIRAKVLLSVCQFGTAATLFALYFVHSFQAVFPLYVLYSLLIGPTFALANAITFHNSTDAKRTFGFVRMWGTAGWVFLGWVLSFFWMMRGGDQSRNLPDVILVAAFGSLAIAIYALTLPSPKLPPTKSAGLMPTESIRVFRKRIVFLLTVLSFALVFVERFHFFGASPFLRQSGFPDSAILPAMSLGQFVEIIVIAATGPMLTRFGFRKVILAGIACEVMRFLLYFIGMPAPIACAALAFHGFTYPLMFMAAQIYIDAQCSARERTGVQLINTMLTSGLGSILGNLVCGYVMDAASYQNYVDYRIFWGVPLALSGMILLVSLIFLRDSWMGHVKVIFTRLREWW